MHNYARGGGSTQPRTPLYSPRLPGCPFWFPVAQLRSSSSYGRWTPVSLLPPIASFSWGFSRSHIPMPTATTAAITAATTATVMATTTAAIATTTEATMAITTAATATMTAATTATTTAATATTIAATTAATTAATVITTAATTATKASLEARNDLGGAPHNPLPIRQRASAVRMILLRAESPYSLRKAPCN